MATMVVYISMNTSCSAVASTPTPFSIKLSILLDGINALTASFPHPQSEEHLSYPQRVLDLASWL